MANTTGSKSTVPAQASKAEITSNEGGTTANLLGGFVSIMYYESILQDSVKVDFIFTDTGNSCLLYTSPSPRDRTRSRMPSSA